MLLHLKSMILKGFQGVDAKSSPIHSCILAPLNCPIIPFFGTWISKWENAILSDFFAPMKIKNFGNRCLPNITLPTAMDGYSICGDDKIVCNHRERGEGGGGSGVWKDKQKKQLWFRRQMNIDYWTWQHHTFCWTTQCWYDAAACQVFQLPFWESLARKMVQCPVWLIIIVRVVDYYLSTVNDYMKACRKYHPLCSTTSLCFPWKGFNIIFPI